MDYDFDVNEFEFESKYQDDLDALEDLDDNSDVYNSWSSNRVSGSASQRKSESGVEHNLESKTDSQQPGMKAVPGCCESVFLEDEVEEEVHTAKNQLADATEDIERTCGTKDTDMPRKKRARIDSGVSELSDSDIEFTMKYNLDELETRTVKRQVLNRIPAGNYVSSTTSDGKRVYMQLLDEEEIFTTKQVNTQFNMTDTCRLLPISCRNLHIQLEKERAAELMLEINRMTTDGAKKDASSDENSNADSGCETHDEESLENTLWVEKFKPRNFLELLSDDGTNRTLLHWLKLWDKVVFNIEVKVRESASSNAEKEARQQQQNKFKKKSLPVVNKELDSFNRPQQKIALLCGPPGLGKTTLAHIIARHAGYNVVEMNASDDRSPQMFKTQIEAATQMRAVLGQDPKPNCLIIDEIDGAPLASITLLTSMVCSKAQETKAKSKTTRRNQPGLMLRPIICICNDQYVPALRPLRAIAIVLNFPPTMPVRLASRLLEVSRKQKMKTDTSTLLALCEKADNDIRSCLATLQFIHRKQKELKMTDVHSLSVGQKDIQKSLFSVWQEIFHVPKVKRKRPTNVDESNSFLGNLGVHSFESVVDDSSLLARFHKIARLVQSYGDTEKIHQGLFANYLSMRYKDPCMTLTSLGSDWLCFSDIILQDIQHSQNYNLMGYLPFTSVVFHLMFASNSYMRIAFPSAHFEFKSALTRSNNLLITFLNEMSPAIRSFINAPVLVMELLPFLLAIIQPPLRPVNSQLYSSQEKKDLDHLINTMINYNITYQQGLGLDGQYCYTLDPQADLVCRFPETKSKELLTYAAKQMIAREVELEKLRRSDLVKKQVVVQNESLEKLKATQEITPQIPNHRQSLQPKKIIREEKPVLDFFGRKIEVKQKPSTQTLKSDEIGKGDIWFHFKEGYSNAVRKNVHIQDLL